ncbi:MAG: hypothetical protein OEY03_15985 [Rhizobacter sp.]|nr:hypothetical protein [Rhizobacter sp.]
MSAPPAPRDISEPDSFQLPLLGLYADLEMGCGSVHLADELLRCSPAVQLEILSDWQRDLSGHRWRALHALHAELARAHPELPPAQQTALFHSTCRSLGIEVPADFTPTAPG